MCLTVAPSTTKCKCYCREDKACCVQHSEDDRLQAGSATALFFAMSAPLLSRLALHAGQGACAAAILTALGEVGGEEQLWLEAGLCAGSFVASPDASWCQFRDAVLPHEAGAAFACLTSFRAQELFQGALHFTLSRGCFEQLAAGSQQAIRSIVCSLCSRPPSGACAKPAGAVLCDWVLQCGGCSCRQADEACGANSGDLAGPQIQQLVSHVLHELSSHSAANLGEHTMVPHSEGTGESRSQPPAPNHRPLSVLAQFVRRAVELCVAPTNPHDINCLRGSLLAGVANMFHSGGAMSSGHDIGSGNPSSRVAETCAAGNISAAEILRCSFAERISDSAGSYQSGGAAITPSDCGLISFSLAAAAGDGVKPDAAVTGADGFRGLFYSLLNDNCSTAAALVTSSAASNVAATSSRTCADEQSLRAMFAGALAGEMLLLGVESGVDDALSASTCSQRKSSTAAAMRRILSADRTRIAAMGGTCIDSYPGHNQSNCFQALSARSPAVRAGFLLGFSRQYDLATSRHSWRAALQTNSGSGALDFDSARWMLAEGLRNAGIELPTAHSSSTAHGGPEPHDISSPYVPRSLCCCHPDTEGREAVLRVWGGAAAHEHFTRAPASVSPTCTESTMCSSATDAAGMSLGASAIPDVRHSPAGSMLEVLQVTAGRLASDGRADGPHKSSIPDVGAIPPLDGAHFDATLLCCDSDNLHCHLAAIACAAGGVFHGGASGGAASKPQKAAARASESADPMVSCADTSAAASPCASPPFVPVRFPCVLELLLPCDGTGGQPSSSSDVMMVTIPLSPALSAHREGARLSDPPSSAAVDMAHESVDELALQGLQAAITALPLPCRPAAVLAAVQGLLGGLHCLQGLLRAASEQVAHGGPTSCECVFEARSRVELLLSNFAWWVQSPQGNAHMDQQPPVRRAAACLAWACSEITDLHDASRISFARGANRSRIPLRASGASTREILPRHLPLVQRLSLEDACALLAERAPAVVPPQERRSGNERGEGVDRLARPLYEAGGPLLHRDANALVANRVRGVVIDEVLAELSSRPEAAGGAGHAAGISARGRRGGARAPRGRNILSDVEAADFIIGGQDEPLFHGVAADDAGVRLHAQALATAGSLPLAPAVLLAAESSEALSAAPLLPRVPAKRRRLAPTLLEGTPPTTSGAAGSGSELESIGAPVAGSLGASGPACAGATQPTWSRAALEHWADAVARLTLRSIALPSAWPNPRDEPPVGFRWPANTTVSSLWQCVSAKSSTTVAVMLPLVTGARVRALLCRARMALRDALVLCLQATEGAAIPPTQSLHSGLGSRRLEVSGADNLARACGSVCCWALARLRPTLRLLEASRELSTAAQAAADHLHHRAGEGAALERARAAAARSMRRKAVETAKFASRSGASIAEAVSSFLQKEQVQHLGSAVSSAPADVGRAQTPPRRATNAGAPSVPSDPHGALGGSISSAALDATASAADGSFMSERSEAAAALAARLHIGSPLEAPSKRAGAHLATAAAGSSRRRLDETAASESSGTGMAGGGDQGETPSKVARRYNTRSAVPVGPADCPGSVRRGRLMSVGSSGDGSEGDDSAHTCEIAASSVDELAALYDAGTLSQLVLILAKAAEVGLEGWRHAVAGARSGVGARSPLGAASCGYTTAELLGDLAAAVDLRYGPTTSAALAASHAAALFGHLHALAQSTHHADAAEGVCGILRALASTLADPGSAELPMRACLTQTQTAELEPAIPVAVAASSASPSAAGSREQTAAASDDAMAALPPWLIAQAALAAAATRCLTPVSTSAQIAGGVGLGPAGPHAMTAASYGVAAAVHAAARTIAASTRQTSSLHTLTDSRGSGVDAVLASLSRRFCDEGGAHPAWRQYRETAGGQLGALLAAAECVRHVNVGFASFGAAAVLAAWDGAGTRGGFISGGLQAEGSCQRRELVTTGHSALAFQPLITAAARLVALLPGKQSASIPATSSGIASGDGASSARGIVAAREGHSVELPLLQAAIDGAFFWDTTAACAAVAGRGRFSGASGPSSAPGLLAPVVWPAPWLEVVLRPQGCDMRVRMQQLILACRHQSQTRDYADEATAGALSPVAAHALLSASAGIAAWLARLIGAPVPRPATRAPGGLKPLTAAAAASGTEALPSSSMDDVAISAEPLRATRAAGPAPTARTEASGLSAIRLDGSDEDDSDYTEGSASESGSDGSEATSSEGNSSDGETIATSSSNDSRYPDEDDSDEGAAESDSDHDGSRASCGPVDNARQSDAAKAPSFGHLGGHAKRGSAGPEPGHRFRPPLPVLHTAPELMLPVLGSLLMSCGDWCVFAAEAATERWSTTMPLPRGQQPAPCPGVSAPTVAAAAQRPPSAAPEPLLPTAAQQDAAVTFSGRAIERMHSLMRAVVGRAFPGSAASTPLSEGAVRQASPLSAELTQLSTVVAAVRVCLSIAAAVNVCPEVTVKVALLHEARAERAREASAGHHHPPTRASSAHTEASPHGRNPESAGHAIRLAADMTGAAAGGGEALPWYRGTDVDGLLCLCATYAVPLACFAAQVVLAAAAAGGQGPADGALGVAFAGLAADIDALCALLENAVRCRVLPANATKSLSRLRQAAAMAHLTSLSASPRTHSPAVLDDRFHAGPLPADDVAADFASQAPRGIRPHSSLLSRWHVLLSAAAAEGHDLVYAYAESCEEAPGAVASAAAPRTALAGRPRAEARTAAADALSHRQLPVSSPVSMFQQLLAWSPTRPDLEQPRNSATGAGSAKARGAAARPRRRLRSAKDSEGESSGEGAGTGTDDDEEATTSSRGRRPTPGNSKHRTEGCGKAPDPANTFSAGDAAPPPTARRRQHHMDDGSDSRSGVSLSPSVAAIFRGAPSAGQQLPVAAAQLVPAPVPGAPRLVPTASEGQVAAVAAAPPPVASLPDLLARMREAVSTLVPGAGLPLAHAFGAHLGLPPFPNLVGLPFPGGFPWLAAAPLHRGASLAHLGADHPTADDRRRELSEPWQRQAASSARHIGISSDRARLLPGIRPSGSHTAQWGESDDETGGVHSGHRLPSRAAEAFDRSASSHQPSGRRPSAAAALASTYDSRTSTRYADSDSRSGCGGGRAAAYEAAQPYIRSAPIQRRGESHGRHRHGSYGNSPSRGAAKGREPNLDHGSYHGHRDGGRSSQSRGGRGRGRVPGRQPAPSRGAATSPVHSSGGSACGAVDGFDTGSAGSPSYSRSRSRSRGRREAGRHSPESGRRLGCAAEDTARARWSAGGEGRESVPPWHQSSAAAPLTLGPLHNPLGGLRAPTRSVGLAAADQRARGTSRVAHPPATSTDPIYRPRILPSASTMRGASIALSESADSSAALSTAAASSSVSRSRSGGRVRGAADSTDEWGGSADR